MPHALTNDSTRLYFEQEGSGVPIVFVHEFAGDHRSWEPQMRRFARTHRCITFAARGYPPSDVPRSPESYSMDRATDDVVAILDHLEIDRAHIVGLSMGGFTALHMVLRYPERTLSAVVAGAGYGAHPDARPHFVEECRTIATAFETEGSAGVAPRYAAGPARVQFRNKDPRGWKEFAERLASHDAAGAALTMRGVQMERPSLYDLRDAMGAISLPLLIINGDEDEGCLEAGIMMKRIIPTAGLQILRRTGHTSNLEEPEAFNDALADLFAWAEADKSWQRDPASLATSTTGMTE